MKITYPVAVSVKSLATGILLVALAFLVTHFAFINQHYFPYRYEFDIREFEKEDKAAPPPENAIVLTGSSSMTLWNNKAPTALYPLTVIPRGFGGSVMSDLLYFLDRIVLVYRPRAVVIYEGDNDLAWGIAVNTIVEHLEKAISRIHALLPQTRIYIVSVKPSIERQDVWPTAQQLNNRFRDIASSHSLIHYVDVASDLLLANGEMRPDIYLDDQLHLNDKGYRVWTAAIKQELMQREAAFENKVNSETYVEFSE